MWTIPYLHIPPRVLVIDSHQCTLGRRPMHWRPQSIKSVSCVAGESELKRVQVGRASDHLWRGMVYWYNWRERREYQRPFSARWLEDSTSLRKLTGTVSVENRVPLCTHILLSPIHQFTNSPIRYQSTPTSWKHLFVNATFLIRKSNCS